MRVRSGLTVAIACLGIAGACSSPTVPPPSSSTDLLTAPPASTGPTDSAAGPTATPSAPPVTAPPPTPVQSTADAPPCSPPDVAVDVSGQGAGGSILLVIDVTNDGTAACGLNGPPASISLRAGGGSMPLTYQPRPDPWPGDTPGIIAPPVVLQPGGTG